MLLQYSFLGRTATSIRLNTTFRGLAPSPSSGARENYIESCRRESFKTYKMLLQSTQHIYKKKIRVNLYTAIEFSCIYNKLRAYFQIIHTHFG
jgi:hypothetical protein